MAQLEYITNLYLRLEASSISVVDGANVNPWRDESGNNNDFGVALGTQPTYARNATPTGMPAVLFGGAGGLSGPAMNTFLSTAAGTMIAAFKATSVVSTAGGISDCIIGGSLASGPSIFLRNDGPNCYFYNNDGGSQLISKSIVTNQWYVAIWRHSATLLYGALDTGFDSTSLASNPSVGLASLAQLGQNNSTTAWFNGYLAALLAYKENLSDVKTAQAVNYVASKYLTRGDPQEQARDIAGRRLFRFSQPKLRASITVPLSFSDQDLLDDIAVSHPLGITASTSGWGNANWARRPMRILESAINLDNLTVDLEMSDLRQVCTYQNTLTPAKTADIKREGVAIIASQAIETFSRDSDAWVVNPGDGLTVVKLGESAEKVQSGGIMVESSQTNQCTKSSFVAGTSSLTLVGTGVGGSAIGASSSAPLLFDASSSNGGTSFSLKFTAGSPHSTKLLATFPATTEMTGCRIALDHRDLNSTNMVWTLQNAGLYWSVSTSGWTATETFNSMDISASTTTISRWHSATITAAGTSAGSGFTLSVGMASSGTNSRVAHLYHVQLCGPSSGGLGNDHLWINGTRVLTNGSAVSRQKDSISISGTGLWPTERGTLLLKARPTWGSSENESSYHQLLVSSTGSEALRLWYNHAGTSGGAWTFGVSSSRVATYTATLTSGVEYAIAARWTSTEGELGTTGRTLSIFVDGVKGTDGTHSSSYSTLGGPLLLHDITSSYFGVTMWNGAITNLKILPYCLSDDEIAAWSS